ncbi:MAG: sigma-70 family RNA polymerase sigma factor [Phycisphaerae bacterium]|nr:sigma-70 family RNA polymerase sigma factor [Phycisphaerae bacterium]
MKNTIDYIELVQQAQLGDKECRNRLAEAVRVRLYSYVYRHTLSDDLTHDIVQESILKMLEALEKLRKAEVFWPWLYKIALNTIRSHYKNEQNHITISDPDMNPDCNRNERHDAIAGLVYQEFSESVFAAMRELKPDHRSIINMRCYDEMQFSEIAKIIGRSEFAAQKLFYRAKKSLKKKLARHGLGKGSLLMALALFGKLTAETEAAAASILVTSATVKVGTAATIAAIATGKTAVVSLAAAGALTVGAIAVTSGNDQSAARHKQEVPTTLHTAKQVVQTGMGNVERCYYYPPNGNGAVMMRVKSNVGGEQLYSQWLQNDQANYYKHDNVMYIRNCRQWADDLSVRRLPTDSPELTDFISRVEGKTVPMEYVRHDGSSLLVISKENEDTGLSQIIHRYDTSSEEYFRYDWQGKAKIVDQRDAMHKRGWTYFRVDGRINGIQIQGKGAVPFVYATSRAHRPWIKIWAGHDAISEASLAGLSRPWMGLHTIDTVRRDAAEQAIHFETKLLPDTGKAEVTITNDQTRLVYTIDMQADLIEKITFLSQTGKLIGQLDFTYLQEVDNIGNEFTSPRKKGHVKSRGILWLCELVKD